MTVVLLVPAILFIIGLCMMMRAEAKCTRRKNDPVPTFVNGRRGPAERQQGVTYFTVSPCRPAVRRRNSTGRPVSAVSDYIMHQAKEGRGQE